MYEYHALLVYVVDGDTYDFEIDLGFNVRIKERVRLANIDTPELRGPDKVRGYEAANFAAELLKESSGRVVLRCNKYDPRGKYGRVIASVTLGDGSDLAARLRAAGHTKYNAKEQALLDSYGAG